MSSNKDSITNVLKVALLVCLACAIVVSTAAVALRPIQQENRQLDLRRNILAAAGLLQDGVSVQEQFEQVDTRLINLETGEFSDEFDTATYEPRDAIRDPALSEAIPASEDIAGIKRREQFTEVYLINDSEGQLQTLILPVRGYGLWSTLWGFIALDSDLNTVRGFGFYEHAETPGLGGEVDNPNWKEQFIGKEVYGDQGSVELAVKKGSVNRSNDMEATHMVDGLSGATLTSRGVTSLIQYWLGERGFKPFLTKLEAGEA
ncbi:Na(+)-translocating NADH-quinone reductase subunit C [Saccharospirillum alexandrii]|uniref:Na(+)-translocating NADH-quinone reductase subunit C n=1 Tax=Saccharospirillum alexandrii TaxID=2448477 RepID=UPI0037358138